MAPSSIQAAADHPLRRILTAPRPGLVWFRRTLLIAVVLLGTVRLVQYVRLIFLPDVYRKDFIQEYLLARAALAGVDPYQPLPTLAAQFLGTLPTAVLPNPTPHPPPVVLLSLPFGLVNYRLAAALWLGCELLCIPIALGLLLTTLHRRPAPQHLTVIVMAFLVWSPVADELMYGQLMIVLLLLLVIAWRLLRSERHILGGCMLGLMIALKLMAWPIVLLLLLRRNWRAVIAAGGVALAANGLAAAVIGLGPCVYYYQKITEIVTPLYRSSPFNLSAWSVGWRLFSGTGSQVQYGLVAPPLVSIPVLAALVSVALPAALLVGSLILALRTRRFDSAFAIMASASILLNPIAWSHYLVLTALPVAITFPRLAAPQARKSWLNLGIVVVVALILPPNSPLYIARVFARQALLAPVMTPVSFVASMTTFFPALAVLGLLGLAWKTDPDI